MGRENQIRHESESKLLTECALSSSLQVYNSAVNDSTFSITSEHLSPKKINEIVLFLNQHPSIRTVKLIDNQINDEGAKALATLNLDTIILFANHIGDEGAQAIAENPYFKTVDLSYNRITANGAGAFQHNSSLKQLLLAYNKIGDNGAIALSKMRHLQTLNVVKNNIGKVGLLNLAQNITIAEMYVHQNASSADIPEIRQAFNNRVKLFQENASRGRYLLLLSAAHRESSSMHIFFNHELEDKNLLAEIESFLPNPQPTQYID